MEASDLLISELYRSAASTPAEHFKERSLRALHTLLPFDAALWAIGSFDTRRFHSSTLLELPPEFPQALLQNQAINPIVERLYQHPGQAVDMADVMPDEAFYQSNIYHRCFEPYDIERVLSSGHLQVRSGIFTILSLYRFDRDQTFSPDEKALQNRILFHLLSAASHNAFMHLKQQRIQQPGRFAAICDQHGYIYEAEPEFIELIDQSFPNRPPNRLPSDLEQSTNTGLAFSRQAVGDLFCVEVWPKGALDILTEREQDVVDGVCQGQTFKEIARGLGLSPSTVSNHLYRIYNKLNVNSRSELIQTVQPRT